jgi:predicted NACHT family NTPase
VKARENPFAAHRLEGLPFEFPEGDSWEQLLVRLELQGWHGAIIGAHGSGKTTLLEQLAPRLAARGFAPNLVTLRGESPAGDKQRLLNEARSMRAPDFLLIDGAEQLTTRQWLPLKVAMQKCAGYLVTLHWASRLPVVFASEPSPALLDALVYRLCDAWLPEGEAELLFSRHRGNVRECLRELYDRWAGGACPEEG